MSRDIDASLITDMAAGVFVPFLLVELEFDTGYLYMWNGLGEKVVGGKTYTGVGTLLGISEAEETSQVVARGMRITLSGVPSALTSLAIAENFQGRKCVVRWGSEGNANTAILFSGVLDTMPIEESSSTSVISVTVENHLAMLDRSVNRIYSDQSQKSRYPNDDFFSHVTNLGNDIEWGG